VTILNDTAVLLSAASAVGGAGDSAVATAFGQNGSYPLATLFAAGGAQLPAGPWNATVV